MKNYLGTVTAVLGVFVLMHYYFSYEFLVNHLYYWGYDYTNVICSEDALVILLPISLIVVRFFIAVVLMITALFTTLRCTTNNLRIINNIKWIFHGLPRVHRLIYFFLGVLLLTVIFIYSKVFFVFVVFLLGLMYFFVKKRSDMYPFVFVCGAFIFLMAFYKDHLGEKMKLYNQDAQIFFCDNKIMNADSDNIIFVGKEWLLIQNSEGNIDSYPTSEIKRITWAKLKTEDNGKIGD